jgi:radical SAM protein with 4Fe4S-binding SPASM domain
MIPWRNLRRFFDKTLKQPGYALKVFLKRLAALKYYSFARGRADLPEAITLFLTHRCNLRCKMCGQWGEAGVTKKEGAEVLKEELSLEQLKGFIDDVSDFRPNITLFGGEPLLFSGSAELIRSIKARGMHCLIITNGSMLEGMAESMVDSGLDELNVSLDAGEQLHDQIRGLPGLFTRIMQGLEKINYYKARKYKQKPLINLQCTITKFNYQDLEQMIDVARQVKANSLTFHHLIFLSREIIARQRGIDQALNCSSLDWEGFVFEPGIDTKVLEEKKSQILSQKYDFSVDFYPNFSCGELVEYYNNPGYLPPPENCRCLSPWLVAYIFPDGEVRPCLNFNYSLGNIKEERFVKLWHNAKALHFRKILKENKIFPACIRCTELYRY